MLDWSDMQEHSTGSKKARAMCLGDRKLKASSLRPHAEPLKSEVFGDRNGLLGQS